MAAAAAVYLSWVSAVVQRNETMVISGSGIEAPCEVELNSSSSSGSHAMLPPLALSSASIMATVPSTFPAGPASVRVKCGAKWSNQLSINEPRVWWVQGSCGNATVSGGWVRVFGDGLSVVAAEPPAATGTPVPAVRRRAELEAQAADALHRRDFSALASVATQLASAGSPAGMVDTAYRTPRLRLAKPGVAPLELVAKQDSLSQYHAEFNLPPSTPAGDYTLSYANEGTDGWIDVDFFDSPRDPHVRTLAVRAPALPAGSAAGGVSASQSFQADTVCRVVPPRIFSVTDYHCPRVPVLPQHSGSLPLGTVDATAALLSALAAAKKDGGGGTVYFPRGTYYLSGSFEVPHDTYLKGAGTSLVSLYWAEANRTHHPRVLFTGDPAAKVPGGLRWGLSDLTLYATAYYYNIIMDGQSVCEEGPLPPWSCTATVDSFTMLRVRIRANAYFASVWGAFSHQNRARPNVDFNFTQSQIQGAVMLTGSNWRVQDNDILATGGVFWSGGSAGGMGGTRYGLLSRNRVRNGGGSLQMDQWKQVIVEDNIISGASFASGGNNIATYNGGYAQHIMLMNNTIEQVWGGDREVVTYDNAGGAYFGTLQEVSSGSATVTASGHRIPVNRTHMREGAGAGWIVEGGALLVLNGSGAGQIRRIVAAPNNSGTEWTLDAPLEAMDGDKNGQGDGAFVQILPFRGRNIFYRNKLSDVGALQFYGIGIENIVSENTLERMAGLVSWGQWRGLTPAPAPPPHRWQVQGGQEGQEEWEPHAEGLMGCGANPNLFNVFERNDFREGNTVVNYNTAEGASYNFGGGYLLTSTSGGGAGGSSGSGFEELSMNSFSVFRHNLIQSNGGILIDDDSSNILVEANTIRLSDLQICVTNSTRNVLLRGNEAEAACYFTA